MAIQTGKGLIIGLWTTLKHFFRPAITVQYPKERVPIPPRMRGRHGLRQDENGQDLCIGCKACERICPDHLITVTTSKAPEGSERKIIVDDFTLELEACIYCGLCTEVCPTQALVMTTFFETACRERAAIKLDKKTLIDSGRGYALPD